MWPRTLTACCADLSEMDFDSKPIFVTSTCMEDNWSLTCVQSRVQTSFCVGSLEARTHFEVFWFVITDHFSYPSQKFT